jgi:hypothetical protein
MTLAQIDELVAAAVDMFLRGALPR